MSSILFAAKHSWITLRTGRPVFVAVICRSHVGLSANEKEETFASNDNSNKRNKVNNQSNWLDVNQLTIYMLYRGFELGLTTENKSSYRGQGGGNLNSGSPEYKSSHLTARPRRLPSRSLEVRNPCLLRPYEIVFVLPQTFFKITRRLYTMRNWGKLVYRSICTLHFVSNDKLRRFVSTMVWDLLASSKSASGLLQFFFACLESFY